MNTTWQKEFDTYLDDKYQHKSEKTPDLAKQHLRVFSKWWEEINEAEFEPTQLTSIDLQEFRRYTFDEEKRSANTWNSRLWSLRMFCEHLGIPELTDGLRAKSVGYKAGANRSLTRVERLKILRELELQIRGATTEHQRKTALLDSTAIGFMLYAGLRVSEVADLKADDIDIIGERTWIVTVRKGKGNKERDAHLGQKMRHLLDTWLEFRLATDMDTSSLFNVSDRTLQGHVKKLGKRLGIEGLTPHWFRYTFAKRLEKEFGASMEEIRDLLGHASIETTRRYLASGYDVKQSLIEEM